MSVFYVDFTTGDDSDTGLSEALAWKTVAKVNASTFSAGDSILFKKGEAWREQLTVPSAGGAGNAITIGAYGTGADPVILGSVAVSTWTNNSITEILGNVLTESFNATGYDTTSPAWSETVGAGSTVDEDSTTVADSAGGSSQILKIVKVSPNWAAWTRITLAADNPITYSQFYVYIGAEGLANSGRVSIAAVRDSTAKATWELALTQDSGGVVKWALSIYTNGTTAESGANPAAATGQWYKMEVKYDNTNSAWEWKVNNVSAASGSLTGTKSAGIKDVRFGSFAVDATANTYYIDALKISSTGYPVAGSTGNTWKATYAATPVAIWAVDPGGLPHWGVLKANDAACTNLYDWFSDGVNVYINSGGTTSGFDPDTLWNSVEVALRDKGIFAQSKANITVQDIHTRFASQNGIYLYRLCHNWIVQRCTSDYNFSHGIAGITGGTTEAPNDVLVDACESAFNGSIGIALSDYGLRWTVSNNDVHHNGLDATQAFPAGIKLYGPNGSGGHIIEHNEVYNNGNATDLAAGGAIWVDRLDEVPADPPHTPVIIRFNNVHDNLISGIFHEKVSRSEVYQNISYSNINGTNVNVSGFRLDAFASHSASTNHIYNNVLYGNYIGMQLHSDSSSAGQIVNNLIKNNISYGNTLRQLSATAGGNNDGTYGSGNVYANNLFGAEAANFIEWGSGVYKSTIATFNGVADDTSGGGNNITGDPLLVSPTTDFHLQATSPCINAGVDVGLTEDYDGNLVPQGATPDIGAYELMMSNPTISIVVYRSGVTL